MKSILLCKKSKEVLSEANGEISPQRTRGCTEIIFFCLLIWKQIATFAFEVKYDGSKKYKSHIE